MLVTKILCNGLNSGGKGNNSFLMCQKNYYNFYPKGWLLAFSHALKHFFSEFYFISKDFEYLLIAENFSILVNIFLFQLFQFYLNIHDLIYH